MNVAVPEHRSDVLPTTSADPGEIVRQIHETLIRDGYQDLRLAPGCGRRMATGVGETWFPLVTVELGAVSWMMTPATARAVAVHVAAGVIFDAAYGSAEDTGLLFTRSADTAEAMARGDYPFHQTKELN